MAGNKLHILMTADTIGGVWTYSLELVRSLVPFNVKVTLVTMGKEPSVLQRKEALTIPQLSLYQSNYKLEWMDNPWEEVDKAGKWLLEIEKKVKPDIIHLNGYCHAALNWKAPVLVVAHSCVLSWWKAVKGECAPHSWNEYRKRVHEGLQKAKMVVTPTQSFLSEMEKIYGRFKNSKVIYNGRNGRFYSSPKKRFLFSMGRLWDEAKNITLLLEAASNIKYPIYIAGTKPEELNNVPHNVHFLGFLTEKEIAKWLSHASIYVLPVKYEPFGLSILEAALAECALVVGDIPTMRELWNYEAYHIGTDDALKLAETCNRLLENQWLLEKLAKSAREKAMYYNMSRMAIDYVDAYKYLLPNTSFKLKNYKPYPKYENQNVLSLPNF